MAVALRVLFIFILSAESVCAEELTQGLIERLDDGRHVVEQVAPAVSFRLDANESLHPSIGPEFSAEWRGFLTVAENGHYTFFLSSPSSSTEKEFWSEAGELSIDDQPALGKTLSLTPGSHALRLRCHRKPGPAALVLSWESEFFKCEPISGRFLKHAASAELDSFSLIERGRQLFDDLNCAACHQLSGKSATVLAAAPDLSGIGGRTHAKWISKWLEKPGDFSSGARMPALALTESDRQDIATYLCAVADPHGKLPKAIKGDGGALFDEIGCAACHSPSQLTLNGLGSKYDLLSLRNYLLNPAASDRGGRMPNLFFMNSHEEQDYSRMLQVDPENRMPFMFRNYKRERETEAQLIAQYLLQSRRPEYEGVLPPGNADRGEKLLQTTGCLNCHTLLPRSDLRTQAIGKAPDAGAVKQSPWLLLGPFNSTGRHTDVYPPEKDFDLNREYNGAGGKIRFVQADFSDGKVHDLFDGRANTMAFLHRTVEVERELFATLRVGSDDTITVFVNGERVFEFDKPRGMPETKDLVSIHLKKGKNSILLKVGNEGGAYQYFYELGELALPLVSEARAPKLTGAGNAGCLAENPETAPDYHFTPGDRGALQAFLKSAAEAPDISPAPVYSLWHSVESLRCNACHVMNGRPPVPGLPDYPPSLSEAGAKLRPEWIERVLDHRQRIRPWMKVRMPDFAPAATHTFMHDFSAAAGAPAQQPAAPAAADPEPIQRGLMLLGKGGTGGGFGCIECHDFRGRSSRGVRGPEMTEMYERIRPEWYRRWLRQPLRIQPGTAMPVFFGAVPDDAGERKIGDIWAVLSLGAGIPKPAGIVEDKSHLLTVTDKPVMIRSAMPDSSPRSIAVGLPGFLSYCFDAQACSLRYAWYGEFLDVTPLRTGMGARAAIPLGKRIFTGSEFCPLRTRRDEEPKIKFLGYVLVNDLPKFHLNVGDVEVWETISNTAANGQMALRCAFELGPFEKEIFFIKPTGVHIDADAGIWDGDALRITPGTKAFSVIIGLEQSK